MKTETARGVIDRCGVGGSGKSASQKGPTWREQRFRPGYRVRYNATMAEKTVQNARAPQGGAYRRPRLRASRRFLRGWRKPIPSRRANCITPTRSPCSSPSCSRRRRRTRASTRRRRALFELADTPAKMAALGEEQRREAIKTIGLFRNKAKNVIALSRHYSSKRMAARCRTNRDALEALPGVGRKTANVVLNIAFGEADDRGGHAYFPRREPHGRWRPARPRARWKTRFSKVVPEEYLHARASLAHSARPLRVQGAQARMPTLPDLGSLPLQRQDDLSSRMPHQAFGLSE